MQEGEDFSSVADLATHDSDRPVPMAILRLVESLAWTSMQPTPLSWMGVATAGRETFHFTLCHTSLSSSKMHSGSRGCCSQRMDARGVLSPTAKCTFHFTSLRLTKTHVWIMLLLQPEDGCQLSRFTNKKLQG
jgi:hypothetical protein